MPKILSLINGPNLNLLGTRETDVYGTTTLDQIVATTTVEAKRLGFELRAIQSNSEGDLVDAIQQSADCAGIVINPAAYTHTSIAIRDAISGQSVPVVEVHLSNIYKRESFRQHSHVSQVSLGLIAGFGAYGYLLAVQALANHLSNEQSS